MKTIKSMNVNTLLQLSIEFDSAKAKETMRQF